MASGLRSASPVAHSFRALVGSGTTTGGRSTIVTDAVRKGVTFAYFNFSDNPANSVRHRVPDPMTNRYRFKLGKGKLRKIGESPYKDSFTTMSFAPRHIT